MFPFPVVMGNLIFTTHPSDYLLSSALPKHESLAHKPSHFTIKMKKMLKLRCKMTHPQIYLSITVYSENLVAGIWMGKYLMCPTKHFL